MVPLAVQMLSRSLRLLWRRYQSHVAVHRARGEVAIGLSFVDLSRHFEHFENMYICLQFHLFTISKILQTIKIIAKQHALSLGVFTG